MEPKNARIVCCINQKGGVAKSTTAEALADGLTLRGYRTLLIDLDPQGSVSMTSGADPSGPTAYEVVTKQCTAQEATQQREYDVTQYDAQKVRRADIIPASNQLAGVDIELTGVGKEHRLKEQLKPLLAKYSYIVIDTPPALGLLTVNALTATNLVIVPCQADVYSMLGITQLADTIEAVREYTNPDLSLAGVLLTRHNSRSVLSRDMAEAANMTADKIGTFLYKTVIREAVAIKEAQANCQSIYEYAPRSNAALDYEAFVDEFLLRGAKSSV